MNRIAPLGLAAALTAVLLASCGPTTAGPAASGTPAAAPSPSAGPFAAPSPAPSAAATPPGGDQVTDPGAPTATADGTETRPGLGGVPDPAALPIPATPRTTPNLGDASFIQPVATLGRLPDSPVISGEGFSGAKVDLIQHIFGIERTIGQTDAETIEAILGFQERNGLEPTGDVGRETWSALFPDVSWEIDRYRTAPVLPVDAPAEARIEQMIRYIRTEALGARYVWGAAGPREYGYDCSGLMLQAMYSAGIDPQPINVVDHQRPPRPRRRGPARRPGLLRPHRPPRPDHPCRPLPRQRLRARGDPHPRRQPGPLLRGLPRRLLRDPPGRCARRRLTSPDADGTVSRRPRRGVRTSACAPPAHRRRRTRPGRSSR